MMLDEIKPKFKVRFGEAPKPATEAVALPSKGCTPSQTPMNTGAGSSAFL